MGILQGFAGFNGSTEGGGGGGDGSMPVVVGTATPIGSTGSLELALSHTTQSDDIVIVFVESNNEAVTMVTSGYTEAPDSPASNAGTNPTRLTVFWKRSSGGETHAEVNAASDHIVVAAIIFRGCLDTGSPFDVTNSTSGGSGTGVTIPGDTTTVDNCLIVAAAASTFDNNWSTRFGSWTNASLTSLTERCDQTVELNAGGGLGIVTGEKATAGAFNDTTATQNSAGEWAGWVGALKPNPPA